MAATRLTGLIAAVFVLVTACGGAPDEPVADQLRDLVNRPAVLDEAENLLIGECMSRAGMSYPHVPPPRDERPTVGLVKMAAPLRLEDARRDGYPDAVMKPQPSKGPVEAHAETLSPDARDRFHQLLRGNAGNDVHVALAGTFEATASSSGCVGSARKRLYGSVANFLTVYYLPELAQRQASKADEDPDVRAAYGEYAQCMSAKGHHVASPAEAVALAKTRDTDEIATASADAECRAAARLHERRAAAADRIVRNWLADNESTVSQAHALLTEAHRISLHSLR